MKTLQTLCLYTACLLTTLGCTPAAPPPVTKPAAVTTGPTRTVLISAAASTQEVMEELAAKFSEEGKTEVKVNLGASSALATQIISGAPADLFLSANQEWATKVVESQPRATQFKLLTNRLVLIVPEGNPAGIEKPGDLGASTVKKIALAGESVPAGKYADQVLTKLEMLEKLTAEGKIARGQDVRNTLAFVERGEAEAGIVYATDVAAAKGVKVVHEFEPSLHEEIVYVLVLLPAEPQNPAAQRFFEYLQSDEATAVFLKRGFLKATN